MSDRIPLRRIFDLAVPWVLLAVASAGLVYAISIAATLRDLRALEPITHPDLEAWRCALASQAPEGEPRPGAGAAQQPAAERSADCPPHARQARPE
jgi:hypothetical protein